MYNNKLSPQVQLALKYQKLLPDIGFVGTTGFFVGDELWDIVITYFGDLTPIEEELGITIIPITSNFATATIPKSLIVSLTQYPQIVYVEFPEVMDYINEVDLKDACITSAALNQGNYTLTGEGILIGVVDSGIDYSHVEFSTPDNKTRIVALWDQNIPSDQSAPFEMGTIYTREQINEALALPVEERYKVVPSDDRIGHGTAITGIAAGNGRGSKGGRFLGVATQSELIVVKVRDDLQKYKRGPRNTDVMKGIQYVIDEATRLKKPVVILIGVGMNEGSHRGDSTLELYITQAMAGAYGNLVVGVGNQGNKDSHTAGKIAQEQKKEVQILVDKGQPYYFFTLWKNFSDTMGITIQAPSGEKTEVLNGIINNRAFIFGNTVVLINFSEPTLNSQEQQILVFLESADGEAIDPGIWTLTIEGEDIVDGTYNIWGSSTDPLQQFTRFLEPVEDTTLTIPSTGNIITSVAAYNVSTQQIMSFSGRGYTADGRIKPDLAAPGRNVTAPQSGTVDGYVAVSGTSVAAAFVAGSYAIVMEYAIIHNNDAFMIGPRLQAYVTKNTRRNPLYAPFPNPQWGYGALCLEKVIDDLKTRYNTAREGGIV
ncbi:MAG: S8 family peptidase [Cellulosilyticaceae bacterium]